MALSASKTGSQRLQDLELKGGSKLKGIFTSEHQGNALRQDFAVFIVSEQGVYLWRRNYYMSYPEK